MNLEVDMGNTRFKWRLSEHQEVIARGGIANTKILGEESFDSVFACLDGRQPVSVGVASVSSKYSGYFDSWCQKKLKLTPRYFDVSKCDFGVVNGYSHIEQMGIDRWLAMLAAYSQSKDEACLVVDCGSACTVDMIMSGGQHLGGYIVPGLQLMREALFRDTDRVKLDAIDGGGLFPGKTTQDAVSSGLWVMLLGAVNLSLERLSQQGVDNLYIVFTGGDGKHLSGLFNQQLLASSHNQIVSRVEFKAELVLDGVSLLLSKA